ncbi:hypothetical protein GCM10009775_25400 [Microbacterium aoyamense]|uniref:GGDEF domain-containing protein n=1 Tax=Microbacterium aoyamense TaxID=344166 RepID=A0ABN2PUY8_9MICO|nr:hypothetical protein [Microbacterium aoyamense]
MSLDLYTVSLLTALVVVVSSVVFLVGMLLRKDEDAGRLWGLAFLMGLLTVVSYLVWAATPDSWWAVAVGNAAFVANIGSMWLGARRFNNHPIGIASIAVGVGAVAAAVAVALEGPAGGDWAGAAVFLAGVMLFAGLGAFECLRGEMGQNRLAWAMSVSLGLVTVFFAVRIVAFFALGVDSEFFRTWLDTVPASFLTITLSIVAVVVTTVLLSGRARLTASIDPERLTLSDDDVLPEVSFAHVLLDMTARARRREDLVGVVSLRIDDLPAIATAFGSEAAAGVGNAFRAIVRRYAPTSAFVGMDGQTGLLVGIQADSETDASRIAMRIRRGLFDELSGVVGVILPVVGVGISLSSRCGYEPGVLIREARTAAREAAASPDKVVVLSRGD